MLATGVELGLQRGNAPMQGGYGPTGLPVETRDKVGGVSPVLVFLVPLPGQSLP